MDDVKPNQVLQSVIDTGVAKANLSGGQMLVRGILGGAILACATTLAFAATAQTGIPMVGAILFPAGFVIILLLGLELVTGSFAMLPLALMKRRISVGQMTGAISWAIAGHLIGCIAYAALYALTVTKMGTDAGGPLAQALVQASEAKTLAYREMGGDGLLLVTIKALLCNWMVTLGAVVSFKSTSTLGKIAAMWLPVLLFFGQGFEHAVVNLFVIPAGMMLGADVSFADWWLWNQLPVLVGNFIGGAVLTGLLFYWSHRPSELRPKNAIADAREGIGANLEQSG